VIITLVAHEKNLGILTLTDFLLEKLGRDNCSVVGCNYLISDIKPILKKIEDFKKDNKSVIVKFVIPKTRFSNQSVTYPEVFNEISDVVMRVPKFTEEIKKPVNLEIFKGASNPIIDRFKEFYK
jgi:cellulose biosynthesis protein BcsQ